MKIKRGDKVVVISGKDRGKSGKVLRVDSKKARVVVEGVNIVHKHKKIFAARNGRRHYHSRSRDSRFERGAVLREVVARCQSVIRISRRRQQSIQYRERSICKLE